MNRLFRLLLTPRMNTIGTCSLGQGPCGSLSALFHTTITLFRYGSLCKRSSVALKSASLLCDRITTETVSEFPPLCGKSVNPHLWTALFVDFHRGLARIPIQNLSREFRKDVIWSTALTWAYWSHSKTQCRIVLRIWRHRMVLTDSRRWAFDVERQFVPNFVWELNKRDEGIKTSEHLSTTSVRDVKLWS